MTLRIDHGDICTVLGVGIGRGARISSGGRVHEFWKAAIWAHMLLHGLHRIALEENFSAVEDGCIRLHAHTRKLLGVENNFSLCIGRCLAGCFLRHDCILLRLLSGKNHCGPHARHLLFAVNLGHQVVDDVLECFVQDVGSLDKKSLEPVLHNPEVRSEPVIPLWRSFRQGKSACDHHYCWSRPFSDCGRRWMRRIFLARS